MLSAADQSFPSKRRKSNVGKEMPPAAVPGVGECRICFEVVPCVKVLDCNHRLCIPCLTKLVDGQKPATTNSGCQTLVSCPECRQKTDCSQGVASLKTLYFGKIRCDLCLEKKDTDDIWWCPDCMQTICSKCSIKEHSKKGHHISEWNKMEPVKYSVQYISQVKCARQTSGGSEINRTTVKSFLDEVEKTLLKELQIEPELEDLHYSLLSRYGTRFASSTTTPPNSPAVLNDSDDGAPRLLTKVLQLAGANVLESIVPLLNAHDFTIHFSMTPEEVAKFLRSKIEMVPSDKEKPGRRHMSSSTSQESEHERDQSTFSSNVDQSTFVVPSTQGAVEQCAYSNVGLVTLRTCREISIYNLQNETVQFIPIQGKLDCRSICFTNKPFELLLAFQSNVKLHEWTLEALNIEKLPVVSMFNAAFDIDPDDHISDLRLTWSLENILYEVRINESQKISEIWKASMVKKKEKGKLKEALIYQKAQSKITMLQVASANKEKEHHLFVWDEAAFSILRLTIRDNRCYLVTKILTSPSPVCFILDPKRKLWLYDPFLKQLCHSWTCAASRSNIEFRQVFAFSQYTLNSLWYTPEAIIALSLTQGMVHVLKFKKEKKQQQVQFQDPKSSPTTATATSNASNEKVKHQLSQSVPALTHNKQKENLKLLTDINKPSTSSKP